MQIQIITTPEGLREAIDYAVANSLSKFLTDHQFTGSLSKNEKDLRIKQAQDELQVSRATLNTLLRTGQLEYYNIGRSVRIPKAAIEKFKETQKSC